MVRPKVSMTSPSTGKYPSAGGMAETTRSDGGRSSELLFRPPAHLPEARAAVVRDSFENLEGRGAVVSAGFQRLHIPLEVDRAFPEGQVLVAGFPVASMVVMHVHEPEAIGERSHVRACTVRPIVEMRVTDIETVLQVGHRIQDLSHDLRRLVDVLHGHDRAAVRCRPNEVGEPRGFRLRG